MSTWAAKGCHGVNLYQRNEANESIYGKARCASTWAAKECHGLNLYQRNEANESIYGKAI